MSDPTAPAAPPTPAATTADTTAPDTPVSRVGVALMLGLLALVLLAGIAKHGPAKAVHDLGFRSPPIAVYTLLLLSPIIFEGFYPQLRRTRRPRLARLIANLHRSAPYMIVVGTTMLVMRIENVYDLDIAAALGLDWTPLVQSMEGDVVARMQHAMRSPFADWFLVFVYVFVYALYHVVAMVGFAATGRTAMVRRFTVTWVLIYAIALPFYVLAPVNEAWTTNPDYGCYDSLVDDKYGDFSTQTIGVLHHACGDAGGIVLAISSINNCFPSLHNAFAWALPLLLWRSGWRRAAKGTAIIAALVTLATIELGIHWLIDIAAGIGLALFVTWVAVRFDYRLDHRLRLTQARWSKPTLARDDTKHSLAV